MSNEKDLDWLARNVHVWRGGDWTVLTKYLDCGVWIARESCGGAYLTKDQWLARRAELQNKPSWDLAPEGACWMAQEPYGTWTFFAGQPLHPSQFNNDGWLFDGFQAWSSDCRGEVIGDWRDTLEKRAGERQVCKAEVVGSDKIIECNVTYEVSGNKVMMHGIDMSEQAVTARLQEATDNVLAAVPELKSDKYKFDPFISIEHNQEQDMKQYDGWFERGELPPVGVWCEVLWSDDEWHKTKILAHLNIDKFNICPVFTTDWDDTAFVDCMPHYKSFRPIRTERDVLMSVLECYSGALPKEHQRSEVADAIIAAGFKLEAK